MGAPTLSEQLDDLKEAGIPFRTGVKTVNDPEKSGAQTADKQGSRLWLYRWATNAFKNYPTVTRAQGVRFLADSCQGLPAFIVGIGPSLDADIEALKFAQGRAIIVSTDAAFRPLQAAGIRPDIVLTYDCKAEQSLLWAESKPHHDIPLLVDSCAHPATIKSWQGPVLFYNHWHQQDEFSHIILPNVFPHIGQIPSGATVGNTAMLLAKILGCSPIVAVGMDFCYGRIAGEVDALRYRCQDYRWQAETDDGKPARWVPTEIKSLYDNKERLERAKTLEVNGETFVTDPELATYLDTFLNFVKHWNIVVLNVSETSVLKHHLETTKIWTAIEKYCPHPYQAGRTILHHLPLVLHDPRQHL